MSSLPCLVVVITLFSELSMILLYHCDYVNCQSCLFYIFPCSYVLFHQSFVLVPRLNRLCNQWSFIHYGNSFNYSLCHFFKISIRFILLSYVCIYNWLFIIFNKFFFILNIIWFIKFFYLYIYKVVFMFDVDIFTNNYILSWIIFHSLIYFKSWIPLKEWVSICHNFPFLISI